MNIFAIVLIFVGGLVLTVGDLIMKRWVGNGSLSLYFLGLGVYLIGMVFLSQSFRFKNIAVASLMLVLFNIISLLLVSWFIYQEKLSLIQIIGVLLGLISIIILELE